METAGEKELQMEACVGAEQIDEEFQSDDVLHRSKTQKPQEENDGGVVHRDDEVNAPTFPLFNRLPEELVPLILNKLDLEEKVRTVPLVCKKWYALWLSASALWTTMDFIPWESRNSNLFIPSILLKLMKRARPFLRELHIPFMDYDDLRKLVIRRVGGQLERLSVLGSDMHDKWAIKHAPKLRNVKYLDISQCYRLTEVGIQAFCLHCPSLTYLRVPPKGVRTRNVKKTVHGVIYVIHYEYVPGKGDLKDLKKEDRTRVLHPH